KSCAGPSLRIAVRVVVLAARQSVPVVFPRREFAVAGRRPDRNGVGRARPRIHQPNIFDARRTETLNDGGAVGVDGSGPTAERSEMRQRGGPGTTSREWPAASWSMKQWISPIRGTRGPAVLPIGVRQQSVYQREIPLLLRRRHRTASMPALSFTRPRGIWKMSVPPAASSTSASSRERADAWQSLQ